VTTPLLTYSLGTEPFPLQASAATGGLSPATLTIVATNATGAPVPLQGMSITLPVGPGATGLTPDPAGVAPVPPPGWPAATVSHPPGGAAWVFLAPGGSVTVPAGGSLAFSFNQVQVNRAPGTAQVTVMEGSGGCSPPACPTQALAVTKFPSGWGTVSFWATPVTVPQGGGTTLGWAGPAGATYQIEYYTPQTGVVVAPAAGQPPFASRGEYPPVSNPLSLQQTTTFTLQVAETVAGQTYAAQCQATVTVELPAPVITDFHGTVGGALAAPSLTLYWTTQHAVRCEISTVGPEFSPTGSWPLEWPLHQSYTLTAWNSANVATTATWYVPPVIASFGGRVRVTPSPRIVDVAVELSWAALLADRCTLSGVGGTLAASGSATVTPSLAAPLATACTLAAVNGPQTSTATVHVAWGGTAAQVAPVPRRVFSGLAATPDGRSLLLSNFDTQSSQVTRLDAATLAVTGASPAKSTLPVHTTLAVSPDGYRVFVVMTDGSLEVLDAATLGLLATPAPALRAAGVAVSPDGGRLLVAARDGLATLDATTFQLLGAVVPLSPRPQGVAVSPDGAWVYVACSTLDGSSDGVVAVLDGATLQPVPGSPIPLPNAQSVSVSPDGRLVFAGHSVTNGGGETNGFIVTIDAATLRPGPAIVGVDTWAAATVVSADGSRVFGCGIGVITVMVPGDVTPAG
jgi:hypothetical protein